MKEMVNKVKEPRKRHTKERDLVKEEAFSPLLGVSPLMG